MPFKPAWNEVRLESDESFTQPYLEPQRIDMDSANTRKVSRREKIAVALCASAIMVEVDVISDTLLGGPHLLPSMLKGAAWLGIYHGMNRSLAHQVQNQQPQ